MTPIRIHESGEPMLVCSESTVTLVPGGRPARVCDLDLAILFHIELGGEKALAFRIPLEEHDASANRLQTPPADVALHPGPFVLDRSPLDGTPIGGAS